MPSRLLADEEIRGRFRELRERVGWTQAEAGRRLGTQSQTVSHWESGSKPIPRKHLEAMAHAAGESVACLLVEEGGADERMRRDRLIVAEWMARAASELRDAALAEGALDPIPAADAAGLEDPTPAVDAAVATAVRIESALGSTTGDGARAPSRPRKRRDTEP